MKRGKKYLESAKLVDKTTQYDPAEAVSLVKKTEVAKEWVEDVGNDLGIVHREYKSYWFIDNEIPLFKEEGRNYVEKLIMVGE